MNSMSLNSSYDLHVVDGKIARVLDSDSIMQLVKSRILTIEEEWFLDLAAGLPWYTELMGRNIDLYKIRSHVAVAIVDTEGVTSLENLELDLSPADRKLEISFSYTDQYGRISQGNI